MTERFTYNLPSLFTFLGRHYLGIRNVIGLLERNNNVKVLDIGCGALEPFYFTEMLENSSVHAVDIESKNTSLIEEIKARGILLPRLATISCNVDSDGKLVENEEFKHYLADNIASYERHSKRKLKELHFTPFIGSNNVIPKCADIADLDFAGYDIIYLGSVLQNTKKIWNPEKYDSLLRRIRTTAPDSIIAGSIFYTEIYGPGHFLEELANAGFDFPMLVLEDVCTRLRGGKNVLVADYNWAVPKGKRNYWFGIPKNIQTISKSVPVKNFDRDLSLRQYILLCAKQEDDNILFTETPLETSYRRKFFDVGVAV